jgi:GT2 family glycosyltransferase
MTQAETRAVEAGDSVGATRPSSVLVILVAKDGASWLRHCLVALSRQTHTRLGVLAVDNGSGDGSGALLEQALGRERVIRLDQVVGFPTAVGAALRSDLASEADFVLFLHDDTLLAPDAIVRMVEAAARVDGTGIVGGKVLDWDDPGLLLEIGMSSDRFGYPYSPLEEGEIDQGQYDRVREVMFVSSCAMLVSRGTWERIGLPDERLDTSFEDLDFCWRARMAGFRVLMTPLAEVRHRNAGERGERPGSSEAHAKVRYRRERAALASLLKNYGPVSLLWVLPLYAVQGFVRLAALTASRRFGDAYQIIAAWGWNILHAPGTVARRFRAQRTRRVPDREIRRYMAPAGDRLRRWAASARQALLPGAGERDLGDDDDAEPAPRMPVRAQLGRLALAHPVAAAWVLGALLAAVAYRNLLGASPLAGGAIQAFPASPSDLVRELGSGLRHTGLGGAQAASPALGILGAAGALTFGSPPLLQKILLLGLPGLAAATCYRAVRAAVGRGAPAVIAGAAYALSAIVLWSLSEGRIPALLFLAGLPWIAVKVRAAFDAAPPPSVRWVASTGLGLAVLVSFSPGAALAFLLVAVWSLVLGPGLARGRGALLVAAALALAALLAFPVTAGVIGSRGGLLAERIGAPGFAGILRLSVGPGPGSWMPALYLPMGAALSLLFVARSHRRAAAWAVLSAMSALYLAWLAAGGYLPTWLANPVAFVGVAAFGFSMLVGLGLASLAAGVEREAFGHRQLGGAVLIAVLAVGLLAQVVQAGNGGWRIGGPERLPLTYPLVGQPGAAGYRILWLGPWSGTHLPAPAGPAAGRVAAGGASVSFALTLPSGGTILDVGRGATGPGYGALRQALGDVLAGDTRHGGALLSPFGIRFVVAGAGGLPPGAMARLSAQLDLDRLPAGDLTVFRNPGAAPLASIVPEEEWFDASRRRTFESAASLPAPSGARPVTPNEPVASLDGLLLLSQQFDARWHLRTTTGGDRESPERAFGWAVGFPVRASDGDIRVTFGGQAARDVELALLGLLWAAVLWVTRRPSGG